jgi:hypothetical protein
MSNRSEWDQGYDAGFNAGYDKGYPAGKLDVYKLNGKKYSTVFEKGFQDGWSYTDYEKEECREILARQIDNTKLAEIIRESIINHRPLSIVSLGDGEVLTLAQDKILSLEDIAWRGQFLSYAGVNPPDLEARDQLAEAIRRASYVGPTNAFGANFQPLLLRSLRTHGINFRKLNICDPFFNYELFKAGVLQNILFNLNPRPTVVIIGNRAAELQEILLPLGLKMADPIYPVAGVKDIERVVGEVAKRDFDVALVSAGVATAIICVRIADRMGKVAMKFGHLADEIISGRVKWQDFT